LAGSGGGAGRQIVRIFPRCCTGAASRSPQIRSSTLDARRDRRRIRDLDELVSEEIHVDLVQNRRREAVLSDCHDRMERMRLRAKSAPAQRVLKFASGHSTRRVKSAN
jgi:hypothetical protein